MNLAIKYYSNAKEALRTRFFLTLLILPYILELCGELLFSKPLPNEPSLKWEFSLMFFCLITIEIIYQNGITLFNKYYGINLNIILIPSLIIFLYTFKIAILFDLLNKNTFQIKEIHARYYLPFVWLFIAYITNKITNKTTTGIITINSLFIILSLVIVATAIKIGIKTSSLYSIKGYPIHINNYISKQGQPIILIVLDEYESPVELFKATKDSGVFELSNYLKKNGWQINNSSYSQNQITVNSISSIFNYNFHHLDKDLTFRYSLNKLDNSGLISNLKSKNITVINYGIFNLGPQKAFQFIYFNEFAAEKFRQNFFTILMSKSILYFLSKSIYNESDRQIAHNAFIIENINTLLIENKPKTFYYFHILMPHFPYIYKSTKYSKSFNSNDLSDYKDYYKLTNNLVIRQLQLIKPSTKYKIIITGDHGYRDMPDKISPVLTSTYYFGFNAVEVSKIKSVQDIGSLIYANY